MSPLPEIVSRRIGIVASASQCPVAFKHCTRNTWYVYSNIYIFCFFGTPIVMLLIDYFLLCSKKLETETCRQYYRRQ